MARRIVHLVPCYLGPEDHDQPSTVGFDCEDNVVSGSERASQSFKGVLHPQRKDSKGDAVMRGESNKKSDSIKSKLGLFSFMARTENVFGNEWIMK